MKNHIEGVGRLLSFVIAAATIVVAISTAGTLQNSEKPVQTYAAMTAGRG